MKWIYLLFWLSFISFPGLAQRHALKIGTDIPLQYSLAYAYQVKPVISLQAQAGILTEPYSQSIINILQAFNVEDGIIGVVSNAFEFGTVGEVELDFHFKKNYLGLYGQWFHLKGEDTAIEAVEAYSGQEIRLRNRRIGGQGDELISFTSNLYQLGLQYGRRFPFKNPRLELQAEIALSYNLGSNTRIASEDYELEQISASLNEDFQETLRSYGFVPSLNVYFVYKFGKVSD